MATAKDIRAKLCIESVCVFDKGCGCLEAIEEMRVEHERLHQHIGWLKQYIGGMTPENWRDMKLRAERQLNEAALADQGASGASGKE